MVLVHVTGTLPLNGRFLWGGSHRGAVAGVQWDQGLCSNQISLTLGWETLCDGPEIEKYPQIN